MAAWLSPYCDCLSAHPLTLQACCETIHHFFILDTYRLLIQPPTSLPKELKKMAGGPSQDGSFIVRTPGRRRSSSQGDETPRAGLLQSTTSAGGLDGSAAGHVGADPHPSKRLVFFPEKLLSSTSGASSILRSSPGGLHLRAHTRTESATNSGASRDSAASPLPGMASTSSQSKAHTSPTKTSSARTYDSKLVTREMHRLGNLAHSHLPALAPSLSNTSQATSAHTIVTPTMPGITSGSSGDPWQSLHVHVLPLFNGEPLRVPIEDLNQLVKRHIQEVVLQSPPKALAVLQHDASELIASGMVTLNSRLAEIDDEKLVNRVVELWGFFWDQVLPYVEGALLPLQTDPLLSSLYRVPKAHKPSPSPISGGNSKGSISSLKQSTSQIDVRTVALQSFRDHIILPACPRMYARLRATREDAIPESPISHQPRLQQMLLVLVSQRSYRPISFSLTSPPPQPTPGEAAVQHLLQVVREPRASSAAHPQRPNGAPSFLSAGLPRDRRGRIAQKLKSDESGGRRNSMGEEDGVRWDDDDGGETPRTGVRFMNLQQSREKDKEFLDSLRSPDPERVGGGWGLGIGNEEKKADEEEEDEPMDWDQAQAVVERMVGMNTPQEGRRR